MPRPEVKKHSDKKTEAQCVNCHYFRFVGLQSYCSNLNNNVPVRNPFKSCKFWADRFEKTYRQPKVDYKEQYGNKISLDRTR